MTPDPAADARTGTPKLADRLSALVGQASVRQEDSVSAERLVAAISARVDAAAGDLRERIAVVEAAQSDKLSALETSVAQRLAAIETALGALGEAPDSDFKSHVDEVGGALVLRLDEVLAGLAEQVETTRTQIVAHVEETRAALHEQAETTRGALLGQAEESRTAITSVVENVDATVRGHVGDLAAGMLELGGPSLTREDVDAALTGLHAEVRELPSMLDGVAQAAQLDGVTATTAALRSDLDEVSASLATMRSEFLGLQDAIERRVDDAALALAETLVAVITSLPSAQPVPHIDYDLDDAEPADDGDATAAALSATVPEAGSDDDWAAADLPDDLAGLVDDTVPASDFAPAPAFDPAADADADDTPRADEQDEAALLEESLEQAAGVDEGGIEPTADSSPDDDLESAFAQPAARQPAPPLRRKGIFRR